MSLLVPWLLFPLVLSVLSLGCGLLLERISDLRLPRALILPSGFAIMSLVAELATISAATAQLAVPAVIGVAVCGFGLALINRGLRVDRSVAVPALAALGAFAAYAAPIVLSGRATFAGYIKLDDGATFLAITDRAMEHARSLEDLPISTYLRTLDGLLVHGYPLATFMPLGVGRALVGGDAAWLLQPYLAFMGAMLALGLYELSVRLIRTKWLSAVIAVVAAQAALLYGYALWGGLKELATAWALPLLVCLVAPAVRLERLRHLIPLAAVCALLLGVLNLGAGVWVAPALVFCLVAIALREGLVGALRAAGAFIGFLCVLALPTIVSAPDFLSSNIVSYSPLANLIKPLNPLQVVGIWPAGDFRYDPQRTTTTKILIAIALAGACLGVIWALRRGDRLLPLYAVGALASSLVLYWASTPWIAGKAFATASPAVPLAALTAGALLVQRGRIAEGTVLVVAVAGGVLWSNVIQYHDAWLAPRSKLAELAAIGDRFAGDGPALMTEYEPYGARHFLRKLDAEGASELRYRLVPLRGGSSLPKGGYANIDDFKLDDVLVYRTLVLRRSGIESRPPSVYRLVRKGRWYEAWQRPDTWPRIVEHLSLGDDDQPAAVPRCTDVMRLARLAGINGQLAAVERPPAVVAPLGETSYPPGWTVDGLGELVPKGSGTLDVPVQVPALGRYGVWVGGAFRDKLEVLVDGHHLASLRDNLDHFGQYTLFGRVGLVPGRHTVTLRYAGPDLHPGSGGAQFSLGPIALSTTTADLPVRYVPPSAARSLCGKSLDWIEAISG
jgi:hypothetical protein